MTRSSGKRSLVTRVRGLVVRKFRERFGKKVASVGHLTEPEFLRLVRLPNSRATPQSFDELLDHLQSRLSGWPDIPNVLTDLRIDLATLTDESLVERADRALEGDFHPSGTNVRMLKRGRIDWQYNAAGSREWMLMVHRHAWWVLWAAAYERTGEQKYVQAFVSQLLDWIEKHPLPAQRVEHQEAWRLMEAGLRMRSSWLPVFAAFFDAECFHRDAKMKMLRCIYDHAQFLSSFHTNRNHLVRESNGLLAVGLCLPEFCRATDWVTIALARLDREVREQINIDGSHIEMSIGYQWLTIDEFEITRDLLSESQRRLPQADIEDALRGLYGMLSGVIRPDLSFPQLNDGFILWGAERMQKAAARSGWSEIEGIGSGGSSGTVPDDVSRSFPQAGLHVMRSSWERDANYLVFDTGPYGGPHGHEDKLSFELFAAGAPMLVDPGSYTYAKDDPFRNYFVGSQGHNTVCVDSCSQIRRWNSRHLAPAVDASVHGTWHSGEHIDFASGGYTEGYAEFSLLRPEGAAVIGDVVHERDLIFVKPDYWLMVDYLDAEENHDYEFLFHLAPDAVVETADANGATIRSLQNGARLKLYVLGGLELRCRSVSGAEDPIQGWYSGDHHKKVASTTLIFTATACAKLCVPWALVPLPAGKDSAERLVSSMPGSEPDVMQISVCHGKLDHVIRLSTRKVWPRRFAIEENGVNRQFEIQKQG